MNLNKTIAIIIVLGFLVPLLGILLAANCEKNSISECLLEKEYIMPDFYWHHNIIKYVASYWTLPEYVSGYEDGGYKGDLLRGKEKRVSQSPLYYYVGAGVLVFARKFGFNTLLSLHIFSMFLILITNILFFMLMKKVSRGMEKEEGKKKQFIVLSTSLFVFMPKSLHMAIMIHVQSLFYLFLVLSFCMYVVFLKKKTLKIALLFGLVLNLCLLSSLSALPILGVLGLHVLWDYMKKNFGEGNLLLISGIIGSLSGLFVIIRNKILYDNLFWGATTHLRETTLFNISQMFIELFAGIYGNFPKTYLLLFLGSAFVALMCIYGLFKTNFLKKDLNFIYMTAVLTIILGFLVTCDISTLIRDFNCMGITITNARYIIGVMPGLATLFGIGLMNAFSKKVKYLKIKYLIVSVIYLIFAIDFIYALISFKGV